MPTKLMASPSSGGIALDWADNAESDLAGYQVLRASSEAEQYTLLTKDLLTKSEYNDTAAPVGAISYYQVVAVDRGGNKSGPAKVNARRPASGSAKLALENLDGAPYPDRLVFNRIGSLANPPTNGVHNTATVRLHNDGDASLRINDLSVTDTFVVDPPVTLPADVAPGAFLDVRVKFVAESGRVHNGTLTITSNDATSRRGVQLAGYWQSQSENNQEPSLFEVRDLFGYKLSLVGSDGPLNQKGLVRAQGDEVLSAYWQRADEGQPVSVREIASYHSQATAQSPNNATLSWYAKSSSNSNTNFILQSTGTDGQSVLPHLVGSGNQPALATFGPSAKTFGFVVDGYEFSDSSKNNQSPDVNNGCAKPCGQHLRFWPLKDRSGAAVPNTYFLAMDYAGVNYDYQDNVYIISNIKPAPVLINVGGSGFTDGGGNVWQPDKDRNGYAWYSPANAISEPATAYTGPITNTDNPTLYRTYRGNVGTATPQNQRVLTYSIPLDNGTYSLKLHFVDQAHDQAGQRVFDVTVNGALLLPNLDIAAEVGRYAALVKPLDKVQVTNGTLTITLSASVDFPAISGIEILR